MTKDNVSALVLAAGDGQRIGGRPKAFVEINGVTLLERVVLQLTTLAQEVIVGLRKDDMKAGHVLFANHSVSIIEGGKTRHESVAKLARSATMPLTILFDVARPVVSQELCYKAIELARHYGASATYVRASLRDAVALREGDYLSTSLPREKVILTQTPQAFRRDILLEACDKADKLGWHEISTSALVARAGYKVRLLEGIHENLKITFSEDVQMWKNELTNDDSIISMNNEEKPKVI